MLKPISYVVLIAKGINVRESRNESWKAVTTQFIFVAFKMGFMSLLNIFLVIKHTYLLQKI